MANTVQVTLGPRGRNVAMEQRAWEPPRVSKDGVTVAKEIELKSSFEDVGASLLYHIANNTNISAGDGTTTATILARAIFAEGMKLIQAGFAPMDIKRGIDLAVKQITNFLYLLHSTLDDKEMITNVATISANGDEHIGKLVGSAYELVGVDGIIQVHDGYTFVDELQLKEGMQWDKGYLSPQFITDSNRMLCEFDYPLLLFYNNSISDPHLLINIVEKCHCAGRTLVIIADNVEGEALSFLIQNKLLAKARLCAIRCPGSGDYRKYHLQDLAILTGANLDVVSAEAAGLSLSTDLQLSDLGECRKLYVHKNQTILMDGGGDEARIQERIVSIQHRLKTVENYLRPRFEERLINMQGGIATIKVGGTSDVEIHEKKDRMVDALNCVRSAIDQGILPGGGFALLYASIFLNYLKHNQPAFHALRKQMTATTTPRTGPSSSFVLASSLSSSKNSMEDEREDEGEDEEEEDVFATNAQKLESEQLQIGLAILSRIVEYPSIAILNNAGNNGELIAGKLVEHIESYLGGHPDFWQFLLKQLILIDHKRERKETHLKDYANQMRIERRLDFDLKEYRYHSDILESIWNQDYAQQPSVFSEREIAQFEEYREVFETLFHAGFDSALNTECASMLGAGIVDPLKVTNNAMIDAASVSGMMITTECVITDVYMPYFGPPEVETGERVDPAKHRVPEEFDLDRYIDEQQESAHRRGESGELSDMYPEVPAGMSPSFGDQQQSMSGGGGGSKSKEEMMRAMENMLGGGFNSIPGMGTDSMSAMPGGGGSGIQVPGGGRIETPDSMIENMSPGMGPEQLGNLRDIAKMLEPMMKGIPGSGLPAPDRFELGPEEGGTPMPDKPKLP